MVGRICLDMLKARQSRREDHTGMWLPEPLIAEPATDGPEDQAVIAESIGLALLIVLESLTPPERLAFVLHEPYAAVPTRAYPGSLRPGTGVKVNRTCWSLRRSVTR